jgi:predicted glycogen debranching enzyme
MPRTIFEDPLVSFGRETCGDLDAGLRREWLVTNGLGGYASGTLLGMSSRSYHGLLVAAFEPPVDRIVLVGATVEQATYDGHRYWMSTNQYADGVYSPDGSRNLAEFRLDGTLPVWTYAFADALLERRLWMVHGKNTTYVTYRLAHASAPAELEITPLVTYRDHHALTSGHGWQMHVEDQPHGVVDKAFDDAAPLRMLTSSGDFRAFGRWYWNFLYRAETERGLPDHGDLFAPGNFLKRLEPGETLTIVYTVESDVDLDGPRVLANEQARQRALLTRAAAEHDSRMVQQLVLAADQFIVERPRYEHPAEAVDATGDAPAPPPSDTGRSIIAGYHWFTDSGRDAMISLPGLTLATGRTDDAEGILRTISRYLRDGLLPTNFPDHQGVLPGYNSADATLWFVLAVRAYQEATVSDTLVTDLLPQLVDALDRHIAGTRYGIAVDQQDGLLRVGEPGVQLTWMDAKIDDWVVTPRTGKPVEINALWYNALRFVAAELAARRDKRAATYEAQAATMLASFHRRFASPNYDHLADVVDGAGGDDWSLRPNQIFALSLPYPLVEGEQARDVLRAVGRSLFVSHGLRSLSPHDPAYAGVYSGNRVARDAAYHQGTAWAWLLGAYAEAVVKVAGDRERARRILDAIGHHLCDAGLGTVSEIFDGDAPFRPRGAIAQAGSVAEVLRVLRKLNGAPAAKPNA